MDYEKKYKEALKRASGFKTQEYKDVAAHIFPELQESEDERIIDKLIAMAICYTFEGEEERQRLISWLEKQKERNTNTHLPSFDDAQGTPIIKQEEHKPTDKVEPKFKVKYAGSEYNVLEVRNIAGVTFYGIEDEPNHIDYVQAENCERVDGYSIKENCFSVPTKPIMFSKQKTAWNKESSAFKDKLLELFQKFRYIKEGVLTNGDIIDYVNAHIQELIDTMQKPTEWSDEDEATFTVIGSLILDNFDAEDASKTLTWLHSLTPHPQWKPSDEQMRVLDLAIRCGINRGTTEETTLVSLFNDLKKLK